LRLGAINLTLFSIIVCALSLGGLIDANSVLVLGGILSVLGACASLTWVPIVEVSRDIIAPKNRGKAMGLMFSGTSYGILSTPRYWPWCCLPTAGARFGR
jgi:predicted MFS family arabinose efflux permease